MVSNEYIAGFLDADGYVALGKRGAGQQWSRSPEIGFTNCDRVILEAIQERYPAGRIQTKPGRKPEHNTTYHLKYMGDPALNIMENVKDIMLHDKKKERVLLITEGYKRLTPRNGKYTEEQIEKKLELVEAVMGITMRGKGAY